ncbi:sterol desaturase family protein [Flavobacterium selenitireducens]|uniref:sterol desaturase family protein n=1 Tax=Flavobacterium selenitireducens TaxID=2722704 RepID=UPI00168B1D4E|nr:sterol desaturase family protein [Flavobacterium selenitireducens]MBD3582411.1 sterol desaturase family protein [Flavobacterium selenitireducens]
MEIIADYFATIPSSHRAMILAGGIALFWLIENAFPLFRFDYPKWRHAGINIFFTLTTIVVNFVLAFVLLAAADYVHRSGFGVLNWLPQMNSWLYALVGLLILDFIGAWLAHFVQHKTKMLWRFHLIHHTDNWIDTTSANRHHPGESVIRFVFTTFAVLVAGSPMWLVFLYQSLSVVFSQFNHANVSLPPKLDNLISYFIVSPDMHKVHHHYVLPYTDSNYGNIFAIWDRMFGTFRKLSRAKIVYGVDTHMDPEDHDRLKSLLKIPFAKPRSASGKA